MLHPTVLVAAGLLLPLGLFAGCTSASALPASGASEKKAAPRSPAPPRQTEATDRTSWPLFRGDPRATGVSNGRLPEELVLRWKFQVQDGAFEGTAAIAGGVVYLGDLDGNVYALDLQTGRKQWQHQTDSGFSASPAVRDGRVYLGDLDGRFRCLDAQTGRELWHFEAEAPIDSSANFYKEGVLFGSEDATLYCLNRKTGQVVWKHAIEDQIRCSPTIAGDRTFVAGCDARLHLIDLAQGEEVAGVDIGAPTMVTPAVLQDHVYFGTEGGVLFCVNWKRAAVRWTYEDPQRGQSFRSSPAVTDRRVVFGGRSKRVYALDPQSGEEIWTFACRGMVDSSPVIVGGRVFVGSADGRIYGLRLQDGRKVWQYEAGGGFTGSPAVAQGRMVIASDRGGVYCFGERE